ncbi:MAG: disulfide bond formation protein B [Gammaproteobacteria bacterium]|nr:disulfide bond formation protein B [Gammaproteobacteria bacterium]
MISFLTQLSQQRRFWAALVAIGIALELAALYYQYVLDEWPCVICIHIRIWIAGFVLLGIVALCLPPSRWSSRIFHGLNLLLMIGLLERSWQVLAIERGWVFGDCSMDLGMPDWFALDRWLPALFEVQTTCGYTPLILLNISMAEVLFAFALLAGMTALTLFASSWSTAR